MLGLVNAAADLIVPLQTFVAFAAVAWVDGDGAWLRFSSLLLLTVCIQNLPALNAYADLTAMPLLLLVGTAAALAPADAKVGARADPGDRRAPSPAPAADADEDGDGDGDASSDGAAARGDAPRLSGTWKLVESENYHAYLEAINVGKLLRGIIARAPTSQTIALRGDRVRIVTNGILKMDTTYAIGGAPIEVVVKGSVFLDSVRWDGDALLLLKQRRDRTYAIHVQRALADADTLMMTSTVRFEEAAKPDVVLVQTLRRQVGA